MTSGFAFQPLIHSVTRAQRLQKAPYIFLQLPKDRDKKTKEANILANQNNQRRPPTSFASCLDGLGSSGKAGLLGEPWQEGLGVGADFLELGWRAKLRNAGRFQIGKCQGMKGASSEIRDEWAGMFESARLLVAFHCNSTFSSSRDAKTRAEELRQSQCRWPV